MKYTLLFFWLLPLSLVLAQEPPSRVQEFVTQLTQAPNQQTRLALLQEKPELITLALAQSLNEESKKFLRQRQNAQGLDLARLAQEVAARVQSPKELANALNSEGQAHFQMSNYEQSLPYFERALTIRRTLPDQLDIAQSLNNIGSYYETKGSYNAALTHYEQSLTLKQQLAQRTAATAELKRSLAISHSNIGICHRYLRNFALAQEQFAHSLRLREELKDLAGLATVSNHLGELLLEQGQLERALQSLEQALQHNAATAAPSAELRAQILNNIGLAHYQNKQFDLALKACHESLRLREALKNNERIARTQRRLAMIYWAQKNYDEALNHAQTSARLSAQHPETFWQARLVEGEIQLSLKHPVEAEQSFRAAIQAIESMRTQAPRAPEVQQRFFENKLTPYLALTDLLIAQNRRDEALAYAERTKARVILDLIQSSQTKLTNTTALTALLPTEPLTAAEVAALVPNAETALLEFVISGEKVHLFVLTKANPQAPAIVQTIPLTIDTAQLTALVQSFRAEVAGRKLGFITPAQKLYQQLLKPAASLLTQKKNVVIVPDGMLWELPFQALLCAPNRFLWQDHVISYAPSLTALHVLRQRSSRATKPTAMSLFALGNPVLPANEQASLGILTQTERQVRALSQIYGADASKILVGAAATEAAFKANAAQYSVLHLATHGIYDDQNPMASRVLLAATNGEDGNVEAQEILNMKLTAELVVLSACETGRGKIGPGEGVIGLTWAFLLAGCPTLLASQWEVREDATGTLLHQFHRSLKTARQPRATALRQAALTLLNSPYNHPYYWAGFVLVGDGGT